MRILLINPSDADYSRVGYLIRKFKEDIAKYNQKPGRRNGIIYSTQDKNAAYVWYSATQISIHFGEDNG